MRLIAIPLARSRPGVLPVSTFIAQRTPANESKATDGTTVAASGVKTAKEESDASKDGGENGHKKPPLLARLQQKAADFWVGLGDEKTNKSTFDWKRRTYTLGEKLMDRIEYEEWALKGVDPAVGPSVSMENAKQKMKDLTKKEQEQNGAGSPVMEEATPRENVVLLYPPSLIESGPLLSSLQKLTSHRTPYHRTRMWYCLIGAPFTAPFMLVPVVPNLPFFYVMWRAYSHFKAWKASEYLSAIIEQNRLVPTPSKELDAIFTSPAPPSLMEDPQRNIPSSGSSAASSETKPVTPSTATLLLRDDHVPALVKSLDLDGQLAVELRRALMQTRKSMEEGKVEKLEQAAAEGGRERERHATEKKEQ